MKVESEIRMLDSVMRNLNSMYISFPHSLSQKIVILQHDISASNSFSQRVFSIEHGGNKIPSWFHHQGMDGSVSVNLPKNWYVSDNFLGFVVCYTGRLMNVTTHLILLSDDGMSWMTLKFSNYSEFSNYSVWETELCNPSIHFFLVPRAGLWDTSKANGKKPNDYRIIKSSFSGEMKEFGFRLLYKDEPDLEASLLQMRENNDEPTDHSIGTSISRYGDSERHDVASCSSLRI
uniref:N protein n=1 Tax=Solanum tuberosum TaxID=4113 RepID=M1BDK0_SOLTU